MVNFTQHISNNGVLYFSVPNFDEAGMVKHCFTSRIGGVSSKPYDTLNLGFKTGDKKEDVIKNFDLICNELQIPINDLVRSDQIHKDEIRVVREEDRGKGILYESDIIGIDALITNKKNVALVTVYADCVPIFLLDPKKRAIGLAHAGWKGTVLKIGAKTVKKMIEAFGTNPKDCIAAIGPSIGKCCYEVDKGVIDKFNKEFTNADKFAFSKENDKYMLDLWKANEITLKEIGILERNIIVSNICTKCNGEKMFTYRGDHGETGRMAAIMELI